MPPERITVWVCAECGGPQTAPGTARVCPKRREMHPLRRACERWHERELVPASDYEALEARLERAREALEAIRGASSDIGEPGECEYGDLHREIADIDRIAP